MAPSSYREDGTRQPRLKLIKVAKYEGLQGLSQLPRISKLREVPLCPGPIGIGSLCVFLQCFCRFAGGDWIATARRAGGAVCARVVSVDIKLLCTDTPTLQHCT